MTTQQQQTDEPQELTERVARLKGVISDIPRQLDAENRAIEGLREDFRALSAKVDRLANAVLIGSIALSVSLVGGLVAIFVAVLTRT